MNLKLPSKVSVGLSLGAGVLAVLNQTTFDFSSTWRPYVTALLIFLTGLGISPLIGSKFKAALHLTPTVSLTIASALSALTVASTTLNVSPGLKGALTGILTLLSGIGFGPAVPLAPAPIQKPVAKQA